MVEHPDPLGGGWPLTVEAVREAAEAICPAEHRRNQDPGEPACNECWATAESALHAGWPLIARTLGQHPQP
jgi:hypothetical protein